MTNYASEQGGHRARDAADRTLADDLRPWLCDTLAADVVLSEFPYFQIVGEDIPVDADERTADWLDRHTDSVEEVPRSIRRKGPFRTDLVAMPVDIDAVRTRYARVGRLTSLNGARSAKRRRRRTYCNFIRDGPMQRDYYETQHGTSDGDAELHGYGKASARKSFGWLRKRGFLAPVNAAQNVFDAVALPFSFESVHAIELKLERGEWETALTQAERAACYAGYRWVAMGPDSIQEALAHQDRFQDVGVGLLRVSPADGVSVVVDAVFDPPELTDRFLNHYNVARWDVNERLMKRVVSEGSEADGAVSVDVSEVSLTQFPPLVHGGEAGVEQPGYEETEQLSFNDF